MNMNQPLRNLCGSRKGEQQADTREGIENVVLAVLTSDEYITLPKCLKIVVRGGGLSQNDNSAEGVDDVEKRVAPSEGKVTAELPPSALKDPVIVVVEADVGCVFQDPEGYNPTLMIPCTNEDLEESPPLNRNRSIPLPDENIPFVTDELLTPALAMDHLLALTLEGWPTIHEDGLVIGSYADDGSHPQSTGTADGGNPRRKRPVQDDGFDVRNVRPRTGP